MPVDLLENYIRQYIASQPTEEICFTWQGGEPTLLGLAYFEEAVALQRKYAGRHKITNSLQTNGTLLTPEWAAFFKQEGFLIGISIDGPEHLHDAYRVDRGQKPTFARVMQGLKLLQDYQVDYNTLTVLNRKNARYPREVYRFLKECGSSFLQFIPIVERAPSEPCRERGQTLCAPPNSPEELEADYAKVTPWSVSPDDFGRFYIKVFDEWVRQDIGRVFVQLFDVMLGLWMKLPSSLCVHAETCGTAVAMEYNGDVYSCDHYVYPEYKLGNIKQVPLEDLVCSPRQQAFGQAKKDELPGQCGECEFYFACHGGCPKHRFSRASTGEYTLNYLCRGYRAFYRHIDPWMRQTARSMAR